MTESCHVCGALLEPRCYIAKLDKHFVWQGRTADAMMMSVCSVDVLHNVDADYLTHVEEGAIRVTLEEYRTVVTDI